ncbi:MAG: glycosyltransferase, partial [Candidatus Margulisiibacteriota bacterium]
GIPKDAPVLVFVGRLSKEKNIPFLFDVFKIVLGAVEAGGLQPLLLIVAGGPMEKEYKQLVLDMGISNNIVFAGQKAYPEVFNYYKAGDIFVFSSKTETQGLVIAEAKACGLPAVALDAQGISECIHDGEDGFLVNADANTDREPHLQMFADKILLLLQNKDLRAAMSKNARQNALREFASSVLAKKLELIYNSLSSSERGKQ